MCKFYCIYNYIDQDLKHNVFIPICKCHKRRYYVCCISIGGKELQHQSKRASEHCQNNNRDADSGFYLLNIYYALGIALSIHYQYNTSTCPIIGTVIEVPKVTPSFLTLNYNHRSYPTRPYPCPKLGLAIRLS